jgi:flavin reductase (DIM6/NTAB) family NADH-FMN oxidoreductase RutF
MDVKSKQQVLRSFSNGMYVITSRDGERVGAATITWVSQVSFKPTLIVAAIRPESNVFACLSKSKCAAIHVLDQQQQDVARKFLSATTATDGMINGEPFISGKTSAPILSNSAAHVECLVRQLIDLKGDHTMVILEVVEAAAAREFKPLLIADSPWRYGG